MDIKNYFKEKFKEYKNKREKEKKFLKRHKEIIKKQEELDEEIEKQYKEQLKQENKEKSKEMSKSERFKKDAKEFIDDMFNNSEFEELESVMTEAEKKELEKTKKEEKRLAILAIFILGFVVVGSTVGLKVFGELIKTDLEKVTQPLIEEYYKTNFEENSKIDTIKYLDEDKHIVLATFKSGVNVMCVDNDSLGNDSTYESLYNEYKEFLKTNINGTHMIQNQPKIIYRPYVVNYNYYIDYIDTLPSSKTFEEMYNSGSLDIIDIIIYEGEINTYNIQNMMSMLGDNSAFYLIKMSSQNILNLTIIDKSGLRSFDVTETKFTGDNDIFYMFDQNINKVEFVEITNYSPGYDRSNEYYFTNVKKLKIKNSYLQGSYNQEDTRDNIYLLKLNKNVTYEKFSVLDRPYEPKELSKYPFVLSIPSSTGLIVIGNKEITIGNEEKKSNSFLCRFNLC